MFYILYIYVCVCYREEGTQPVHLLWILRSSVLVQSHHELLTETHKENNNCLKLQNKGLMST